jgi:carboxyl-terminal processing protease
MAPSRAWGGTVPATADPLAPDAPAAATSDPASVPPGVPAQADSIEQAMRLLEEVFKGIQEAYVEPVSVNTLLEAAIKGVHERLDPHTRVLSAEEFQAVRSRQGAAVGIGITLGEDGGRARIRAIRPGSPAERAGLLPGDLLLAINGVSVSAAGLETTMELLRGTLGSVVRLSVASPEQTAREIDVQRETVTRDASTEQMLRGGRIGYLEIHRFARGVSDRVEATLTAWAAQGLDGVVIDLRDNPGGFIDEAARTADLLLPVGTGIVRTVGRLPEENGLIASRREPIAACPSVVLLVDSLTASSAEIFAGALKGQPGVTVLGEPTYGKRTVQRLVPLSNGGALKVTASFYCTPSDPGFAGPSPERPAASGSTGGDADPAPGDDPAGSGSPRGRGRRLQPDRCLPQLPDNDPTVRLEALGLLQRFTAETTQTAQDRAESSFWAGARPPGETGDGLAWVRACERARGFDRWCGRLRSRLREWGWAEDLPASPALRRAWFVDWVSERWGADAGRQATLELDPWIGAAVESLAASELAAEASVPAAATDAAHAALSGSAGRRVPAPR